MSPSLLCPAGAVDCLVDTETCTADNSCEVDSKQYCCEAGHVVRAISMNNELVTCACKQESQANTGYRCTVRSDDGTGTASVTSASWLTCALVALFALLAF